MYVILKYIWNLILIYILYVLYFYLNKVEVLLGELGFIILELNNFFNFLVKSLLLNSVIGFFFKFRDINSEKIWM